MNGTSQHHVIVALFKEVPCSRQWHTSLRGSSPCDLLLTASSHQPSLSSGSSLDDGFVCFCRDTPTLPEAHSLSGLGYSPQDSLCGLVLEQIHSNLQHGARTRFLLSQASSDMHRQLRQTKRFRNSGGRRDINRNNLADISRVCQIIILGKQLNLGSTSTYLATDFGHKSGVRFIN